MFDVITGPFHPQLESTLVQDCQRLKSSDPLTPMAIVVPSEPLRRRLQWLLCVEHQCDLFDVHFLTFHQVVLRLYHEHFLSSPSPGVTRMDLVHDLCFELLLSSLIEEHAWAFEGLAPSRFMTGTSKALWRTIRDLREAMVDPHLVLQGIREGVFEENEQPKLHHLFTVYAMVQEASRALKIGSPDDLASMMIPWVQESKFLSRVNRVCYYGFYDLTQVQLSLFEAITAKCRVTVYFPLSEGPAFAFARRFFDRHLSSGGQRAQGQETLYAHSDARGRNGSSPQVQVMHTVGPEDELSAVCKEILNLVETHQYQFDEVGIVARNLEPYHSSLRRNFEEHRIPFTSSAEIPSVREPLIKHLIQLSRLPVTEYYWRDVLDILSSPFYALSRFGLTSSDIQPGLWQEAVRSFGIHRGVNQWSKLPALLQGRTQQERDLGGPTNEDEKSDFDHQQIELLDRMMAALITDCQALPDQGSIGEMTRAFWSLAETHMIVPGLFETSGVPPEDIPNHEHLIQVVRHALSILEDMREVAGNVTWEQWTHLFGRAVNASFLAVDTEFHSGVRILDAMSARGLPFRALFLIGLNEKAFPRFIREDPFLRDRSRRVLEETFGYKIDEKLAGYEEEQLLFSLLGQAAHDRLYLLYQRADKEGRPLTPSPYLTDFLSCGPELNLKPVIEIPRRLSDRFRHPAFESHVLTREELGIQLIVEGYHPKAHLEKTGRQSEVFQNGVEALREIESRAAQLGSYDGLIQAHGEHWQRWVRKGIAPTSLEVYARCPFQFFATRILHLRSVRRKMLKELALPALGRLYHAVLHQTYRQLKNEGWPAVDVTGDSLTRVILMTANEVLRPYEVNYPTGYFLTWQLTKEVLIQLATEMVESDLHAYRRHGYKPIAFEVDAEGEITTLGPPFSHIQIRGRLDRIDVIDNPPSLRIVDYKFQSGSQKKLRGRELQLAGIRGFHLQPPLYSLMNTFHSLPMNNAIDGQTFQLSGVEFVYLAPRSENRIVRSEFDAASWEGESGEQLKNTFRKLLKGIQAGQFSILPGDYCRHCDVSTTCRRDHGPTWLRAYGAASTRTLRKLRTQGSSGD